jgi:branched-chain amino acid transport system permease protein
MADTASLPNAAKDAALAGLVAALLALPLLGFHLGDSEQGLILEPRLSWVPISAAIVFAGRLLLNLAAPWLARWKDRTPAGKTGLATGVSRRPLYIGLALAAAALLLPVTPWGDRNILDKATLVLIYVMLGWGLNIVVGLAGLLVLGYAAFYAVGAYAFAILAHDFGLSFWQCLPISGVIAALFGLLVGFPVLRLRGDYLAIVTLGFGEIVRVILLNWSDLTGGPNGISGIPRPTFFGLPMTANAAGHTTFHDFFGLPFSPTQRIVLLYYVILLLALVTNLISLRIRRLPIGRAWEALREDEIACRSLGLNPTSSKLSAFALGTAFAGFAGCFFATRQGFISPESFTFMESAVIVAIVVLGGMGSQTGVVLAAVLLVGLPEWFRELAQYRMIAFGGAMVLIMLWRPKGLLAERTPTIRLGAGEAA